MTPDSTSIISANLKEWFGLSNTILGILGGGGIIGLLTLFLTKFIPWCRTKRNNRSLAKRFGAELYPRGVIEQATKYYIEPFCQSVDPAGGEESRLVYSIREKIFSAIDHALYHPTEYRYLILLADSGMGKTSFLLNYYVRNLRRFRRKHKLELLPLGIPDVEERIQKIKDKKDKVLFLDALDEDTLAIVDHVERLATLMQLTREFQKIVLTCRTQFFPKDEEIPRETGIVKIGPKSAGEAGEYVFYKLYLAPFTDDQVKAYLKKRYSLWKRRTRQKAAAMVKKIAHLSARPMLLAHIDDLLKTERTFNYSFELYEEMVEAWLIREEGIKKEIRRGPLREFSECLAINLCLNRQQRQAERVPREELTKIAAAAHIPLDEWQLTGRSLLNRDAAGNYKFAHRSIMEYLFVKRFLELKPDERPEIVWTDQMYQFLEEIINDVLKNKKICPDLSRVELTHFRVKPVLVLRNNKEVLSERNVNAFIKKYDFFDNYKNKKGKGIPHFYTQIKDGKIILDLVTGLMWQQSGSEKTMRFEKAEDYIRELNDRQFAGFNGWRLPTLEEAMSLMAPKKNKADLYIDERFDSRQRWIWTSDEYTSGSRRWVVNFNDGNCLDWGRIVYDFFVRGVRFGQAS